MSEGDQHTHSHLNSLHTYVDENEHDAFTNLVGLGEQTSLNIRSYKLQYVLMFIFLLIVIFLTVRAFSNPFPYFIEYVILVTAMLALVYHIVKRFM
jgi:hypothetical protein